ncbi:hypothetical protein [Pseudalkalibacillus decolorationis]|uniref:hypothetical protein n=1 Tax=Pseudalkalibacillus decolorationis TaxID=163879 RepID=UPI0021474D70|nr:hypothetical protein [Pseudalkalibacillus decolorationis]
MELRLSTSRPVKTSKSARPCASPEKPSNVEIRRLSVGYFLNNLYILSSTNELIFIIRNVNSSFKKYKTFVIVDPQVWGIIFLQEGLYMGADGK